MEAGRAAAVQAAQEIGLDQWPECVVTDDTIKVDVAIPDGSPSINELPQAEASVGLLHETFVIAEQCFLVEWERGSSAELCQYVRVRQIYRAGIFPDLRARLPS